MTELTLPPKAFQHQRDIIEFSRMLEYYALFWEQGVGKSLPIIHTIEFLFKEGHINGAIILAPNSVHRNWVVSEFAKHMHPSVKEDAHIHLWRTDLASSKVHGRADAHFASVKKAFRTAKLGIVCMSYDGLRTDLGCKVVKQFLTGRDCMLVGDESQFFKTPGAARTKRVLSLAKRATFRRILTGTPVDNDPQDIYSQLRFLNERVWNEVGCGGDNFSAYQNYFCTFAKAVEFKKDGKIKKKKPQVVGFRNMDRLRDIVGRYASRLLKVDVLDLPPKIFTTRYFDLTTAQWGLYDAIKKERYAVLDDGSTVTAVLPIVRDLRLQQVASGYVVTDDADEPTIVGDENPRIDVLMHTLADTPGSAIIWAKYRMDITQIMKAIGDAFGPEAAVRYDGEVTNQDDRATAIDRFMAKDARFFVANGQAAGTGLTLTAATTVIFYNNSFRYGLRKQMEDRAHRIGQEHPVTYIDLCASGTIDERIVTALVRKNDLACEVLGDDASGWL